MMALFSPRTQGMAFEPPQSIRTEIKSAGNWTEPQEIQLWSNAVMKWRGECFLTTGKSHEQNSDYHFTLA